MKQGLRNGTRRTRILRLEALEVRCLLTTNFVAFNDHVPGTATHSNTTFIALNSSGSLRDVSSGDTTSVTLTTIGSGVSQASDGGNPSPGTDADALFAGFVDFSAANGNSLQVSGNASLTHRFSGLQSDHTYDFAGTAIRGNLNYSNRWTLITLNGADSWQNTHSAGTGVVTAGLATNQVALWTGANHQSDQGVVAHWAEIDPGSDGVFEVVSSQYTGATPGVGSGDASSGSKGYGLGGIRLAENHSALEVVGVTPADGALLSTSPAIATLTFNEAVDVASVQANDLTVSGVPATSFTIVDATTVQFNLPSGLTPGNHTLNVAANALMGNSGTFGDEFSSQFTIVAPATVDNQPAEVLSAARAVLKAEVLSTGGNKPNVEFYYGLVNGGTNPAAWQQVAQLGPSDTGPVETTVNGLQATSTYYYRSAVVNLAGRSWAPSTENFITPNVSTALVENRPASNLSLTFATLNGTVIDTGGNPPTITLHYGVTDAGAGVWDASVDLGVQSGDFSTTASGLTPGNTYFYRAEASNSAGDSWTLDAAQFTTVVPIVINEIHYNPDDKTELVEFVELHNQSDEIVDLSGWMFTDGISFTLPANTEIAAGGYLVVAEDPAALNSKFGVASLGPYVGSLTSSGERLRLEMPNGFAADEVDYQLGFPWPTVGDSPGHSIQLLNSTLDNDLGGSWRSALPTPGSPNSVLTSVVPPQIRQVKHSSNNPKSGEDVTITTKVTDSDGVASVILEYQLVDPGDYIELGDPRYLVQWTPVTMVDDGTSGDAQAGDDVFTAVLPGTLQTHRRLIRYRITATDSLAASVTGPYADDPIPNFAYFVYDGVPDWTGSATPTSSDVTYDTNLLESVATYHLITTQQSHVDSQNIPGEVSGGYTGSDYLWHGTLVYDGEVYDHIDYRARGGVWRYAMGKNMWKFDFARGHALEARDDYGNKYDTAWDKLNFSSLIQQGNFGHRGEQGLFESVGFDLFDLAGVEGPNTHYVQFRIVESADEAGSDQFGSDFQGLYLAIEQPDGKLLDEHDLPDGNFYKMEGGSGTLNNQGPTQPSDRSDLDSFLGSYNGSTQSEAWWRDNLDLERYYSYRSIVEGIHHYDIGYGKNYFYFHDPETDQWSVHPWDLDLTWADNMYGNGAEPFKSLVAQREEFSPEYRNRMREIRDLLYNSEQAGMLIDEKAGHVYQPGEPSIVDADRAMWDYNPILVSGNVNSSKAGHGRFYQAGVSDDFAGMIQLLKDYIVSRGVWIDSSILTDEHLIPFTPTISYSGGVDFPVNDLQLTTTAFASPASTFGALQWRVAEVTDPLASNFDPSQPRKYEIEADWESGELATQTLTTDVPSDDLVAGRLYRARVRMGDADGLWSHWSEPIEFMAGVALPSDLAGSLRVSEVHYNPSAPTSEEVAAGFDNNDDFEFIEIVNSGITTIDLTGVRLAKQDDGTGLAGVDFAFSDGNVLQLAPQERVVVVEDLAAFSFRYDTLGMLVAGEWSGALDNGGELLTLLDGDASIVQQFAYNDSNAWPNRADGGASSLEVLDTTGDYNDGDNWRSSIDYGGSPGSAGRDADERVIFNEILAHTDAPFVDTVELYNTTPNAIDISHWYLSDSNSNYFKYAIPSTTLIDGAAYLTFDESHFNPGLGGFPNDFSLSSFGDEVWLLAAHPTTGKPTHFVDRVKFQATLNNTSVGRLPNGQASATLVPLDEPSLGTPNLAHRVGEIVISEVQYNPVGPDAGLEFLELYNTTSEPIDLGEWRINNAVDFDLPAGVVIGGQSVVVLVDFDPIIDTTADSTFRSSYGIDGGVQLVGPWQLGDALNDGGERIDLELRNDELQPGETEYEYVLIDRVVYDNGSPWPTSAAGDSLQRTDPTAYGNEPSHWISDAPTPGVADVNDPPLAPLDFNGDGNIDASTDGNLILVSLFGLPNENLTPFRGNTSLTNLQIAAGIQQLKDNFVLDVNEDGAVDASTDGNLILVVLFGLPDDNLTPFRGGTSLTNSQIQQNILDLTAVPVGPALLQETAAFSFVEETEPTVTISNAPAEDADYLTWLWIPPSTHEDIAEPTASKSFEREVSVIEPILHEPFVGSPILPPEELAEYGSSIDSLALDVSSRWQDDLEEIWWEVDQ